MSRRGKRKGLGKKGAAGTQSRTFEEGGNEEKLWKLTECFGGK